jgi:hypothetical protein
MVNPSLTCRRMHWQQSSFICNPSANWLVLAPGQPCMLGCSVRLLGVSCDGVSSPVASQIMHDGVAQQNGRMDEFIMRSNSFIPMPFLCVASSHHCKQPCNVCVAELPPCRTVTPGKDGPRYHVSLPKEGLTPASTVGRRHRGSYLGYGRRL